MTLPHPIVRLRREELARATALPLPALRVLLALVVRACPVTGRVWVPAARLGDEISLPVSVVEDALDRLGEHGFLEDYPALLERMRCVELGAVFVRDRFAPENLPVQQDRTDPFR